MIRMIAACDRNRIMGKGGTLPWNIEEDWKYFLKTTAGGALVMGRKCYEDFTEYAKDRKVVVLSRQSGRTFEHAMSAANLEEGINRASKLATDVWICGGVSIYEEAMSWAQELYLTEIDGEFSGDVYFPEWRPYFPQLLEQREVCAEPYLLTFSKLGKSPDWKRQIPKA